MKPKPGRPVYSTEAPMPRKPGPAKAPRTSEPPFRQSPRVRLDRSGRSGKTVTVAGPFALTKEEAEELLGTWKKQCGTGGALKAIVTREGTPAFELEIQGDHADRMVAGLLAAGYKAKRSGG